MVVNILIVSATEKEGLLIQGLHIPSSHTLNVLVSGVGMLSTSFKLTQYLLSHSVDLVLNIGIAGAYSPSMPLGRVVLVNEDLAGDLGAENKEELLTVFDLEFENPNEFPYTNGTIINPYATSIHQNLQDLPLVSAVSVNLTAGSTRTIHQRVQKFKADIETMEGLAVAYVCQKLSVPYLQIRSISNWVEERNRERWNIPLALENLKNELPIILSNITL